MIRPRVKICCISSVEEASTAVSHGAAALGLVSEMPSGPGVIALKTIGEIARCVPPPVATFLLTSKQTVEGIMSEHEIARTNTIQICDRLLAPYSELRRALPFVKLVQVIHVSDEDSVDEAKAVSSEVDAILLDSGNQKLSVKELGGTGRTHDWAISRKIVESVEVPVFLAGGLGAENVAEAVRRVRPFGLDICSGVRTAGRLDPDKLRGFFGALDRV